MPIIVALVASIMLIGSVLALMQGLLLRTGIAGIREWFMANALMVLAMPLLVLRDRIPDGVSIVFANLLLTLAISFYYAGCARFLQRPPRWRWMIAGNLLVALGLVTWRYLLADSIPMRVLVMEVYSITVCLCIARLLIAHLPAHHLPYSYWFTAGLALSLAVSKTARMVYFFSLSGESDAQMFLDTGSIALIVVNAVIVPVLNMATLMLIHNALLARAERNANLDHVTGALSRKHFESVIQEQLAHAAHQQLPLTLLMIDMDHFKRLNDTHGHAAGDAVLREFVTLTRKHLRDSDLLGRLGGEEFVVALPGIGLDDARIIAERLRNMAQTHIVGGPFGQCRYSISIGIAVWLPDEPLAQLIARADHALYQAKHAGRNRAVAHGDDTGLHAETPAPLSAA